jgi:predicted secreted Zn-dependent protease
MPTVPRLCACLFAGLLLIPPLAQAEVKEARRYTYYDVQLGSGPMHPQLRAASPPRKDGARYVGYTTWHMDWHWRWQTRGGNCAMTSVNINVDLEVNLPRIHGASARQAAAFEPYINALRGHELGHVDIVLEEARALEREILALPPMRDCEALQARARELGQARLARARQRNADYDTRTNHGQTQGAVLKG